MRHLTRLLSFSPAGVWLLFGEGTLPHSSGGIVSWRRRLPVRWLGWVAPRNLPVLWVRGLAALRERLRREGRGTAEERMLLAALLLVLAVVL